MDLSTFLSRSPVCSIVLQRFMFINEALSENHCFMRSMYFYSRVLMADELGVVKQGTSDFSKWFISD